MTIKNRIIYSSIILLALFLGMGLLNWFGNRLVMTKADIAYTLEKKTMHLQGIFRGVNEFIIDEGEPLSRQLTREHLKAFEELHDSIQLKYKSDDISRISREDVDPQWKLVKNGVESFLKTQYINVSNDEAMLKYGQLTTEAKKLLTAVDALAKQAHDDAKAILTKYERITNCVTVLIILMVCFVLFNLYRAITSPIRELHMIAEGFENGDLSNFMDDSKKDEFGRLATYFNHALQKLSSFIGKLKQDINTVAHTTETFTSNTAQIATDALNQASQTSNAVTATEELSATFNEIAMNTENVSNSAREAFELAIESGDVVITAMNSMNKVSDFVKDASTIIESLSHRSSQIGEIIKVIDEIADQTNLLALNANIEAARAGDQGRGFAVVANEVRKLAERTTSATKEIADMIKGIQDDTNNAVRSMQTCTNEVASTSELSVKAGNSLQQIVVAAQNVTEMIHRIAASVEEQSSATTEINSNLEQVASITNRTSEGAQRSSDSSVKLHEMAMELQMLAQEFKLREDESENHTPASFTSGKSNRYYGNATS